MLKNKTIAVVIPAYNEATQIESVLETIPEFVDRVIVVDDCSKDKTSEVVLKYRSGIILIVGSISSKSRYMSIMNFGV